MNNQNFLTNIDESKEDLQRIRNLISAIGSMSPVAGYLTKFALIRVCGTLEICYKTLIADFYESVSPEMQRYITIHVREASLNAKYENIKKVLKEFSEEKSNDYKNIINARVDKEQILAAMSTLNTARNEVAHGGNMALSIADICNHFEKAVCVLEELDNLFIAKN